MARAHHQRTPAACALASLGGALASAPAAASAGGGLEIFPKLLPLLVLIALFTVLIWPANRLLWRPLLRVLDERRDRIAGARARAEKIAAEAQDVLASYQSAVERGRRAADAERARQLEEARGEHGRVTSAARSAAEEEVTAARVAVAAALERARGELRATAEDLGREAAARVLGRALS
jgi:F-type H+-transporting ATPase subunit b